MVLNANKMTLKLIAKLFILLFQYRYILLRIRWVLSFAFKNKNKNASGCLLNRPKNNSYFTWRYNCKWIEINYHFVCARLQNTSSNYSLSPSLLFSTVLQNIWSDHLQLEYFKRKKIQVVFDWRTFWFSCFSKTWKYHFMDRHSYLTRKRNHLNVKCSRMKKIFAVKNYARQ
jgi:hypothetical protein